MGIVDSILERQQALAVQRAPWARAWDELALYCLPMAERMRPGGAGQFASAIAAGPNSMERARHVYDGTSLSALDRLASGMESLVTPQSEKWHGLGLNDPFRPEPTDEEIEWFERLRDYQFAVRYDPRSGFVSSHQKALRNMVALGTAVVFVEEAFGARGAASARDLPILYRHVPLTQNFLSIDAQGNPDTNYRRFSMTPRQMVQRFGERVATRSAPWRSTTATRTATSRSSTR